MLSVILALVNGDRGWNQECIDTSPCVIVKPNVGGETIEVQGAQDKYLPSGESAVSANRACIRQRGSKTSRAGKE